MKLPNVISELVKTQNNYDSAAYADCFTEGAVVEDEGSTFTGKTEIKDWIDKFNKQFKPVMKPIEYQELEKENLLLAEFSGDFPGSPLVMKFHFTIENGLIKTMKSTS